jgi:7-cyano-7-deazaguanine synthase in queuosine biosynthesis
MIVCVSGGLDSLFAWYYLDKPKAIYFKLGHKYQQKELASLRRIQEVDPSFHPIIEDTGLNLSRFEYGKTAYIPHRNLLIALLASFHDNEICIAGVRGDRVEDKSPLAYRIMSNCLNRIQKPHEKQIKIFSPFWKWTKTQILRWFIDKYGRDFATRIVEASLSCYDPDILGQCGRCPSCLRKAIAMELNGLPLNIFHNDIRKWGEISNYIGRLGEYDVQRRKEMVEAFRRWGWTI